MKKLFFCVVIFLTVVSVTFSQNTNEWKWGGLFRIRPMASVLSIAFGGFELVADWVPYVSPNVGIPIEADFVVINKVFGFGIAGGIEAVPVRHKEKSGLYMTALVGPLFVNRYVTFMGRANIGYQIVTNGGFVFTPAIGIKFAVKSGVMLDIMLDIGFGYKKRK